MAVSPTTSNRERLYAPEVAGNTWGYILALHTAASAITARASPFAVAQRRGRFAAGDLIPKQDRLAAGAAVCVSMSCSFLRLILFKGWLFGSTRRLSVLRLPSNEPDQRYIVPKPRQGPLQTAAVTKAQERPIEVCQRMMQEPCQMAAQNRLRMNL